MIASPRPSDTQMGHCVVWGPGRGKSLGGLSTISVRSGGEDCARDHLQGALGRKLWTQVSVGRVAGAAAPCRPAAPSDL